MDPRPPSPLPKPAPAVVMTPHEAGKLGRQELKSAQISGPGPSQSHPHRHTVYAPTVSAQVWPGSQNSASATSITYKPNWRSLRALATDFAIVVCLAYVIVATVMFLTGIPPMTSATDFVSAIGRLCLLTLVVFAALGLIGVVLRLVGRRFSKIGEEGRGSIATVSPDAIY